MKAVFIHVPKTGGKSVTAALEMFRRPWTDTELLRWDRLLTAPLAIRCFPFGHARAVDMRAFLDEGTFEKAFSFGFVRDPIEHTISGYRAANRPAEQTIDRWLDGLDNDPIEHLAYSQWPFLTDNDHLIVSYVGNYDKLQMHFDEVCERINIARRILPRVNVSKPIRPELPKKLEIRIRDMFYRDYNIFEERLKR